MAIPEIGHRRVDTKRSGFDALTQQERKIMRLMTRDRLTTDQELASALFVTERTVQTHIQNIFDKANIRNRTLLCIAYIEYSGWKPEDVPKNP